VYPVKYLKITHKGTVTGLRRNLKTKAVVAKVLVKTSEPVYAVRRDRCVFPVGVFWAVLTTGELLHAMDRGYIQAVTDMVTYEQENIFESYVDKFYTMRQGFKASGNTEYQEFCKYMMNKLYGKFGQKGEEWSKIGNCVNEPDREELVFNMNGRRVTKIRYLLGEVFLMTGLDESFDSFPAIAAHVTGYARLYLWSLMERAGRGNYFYCDTDSLIVNSQGLARLESVLSETALGGLKVDEHCDTVTIRGLKDYTTVAKVVTKGIRKSAVRLSEGVYRQEQWPSFKGLLRSSEPETYVVGQVTKHLSYNYTKGTVTEDGVVEPLVYADSPVSL